MSFHYTHYIIQGIVLAVFLGIYIHLQQQFLYSNQAENIQEYKHSENILNDIDPKNAFFSLVVIYILLFETVISAKTTKSCKRSKKTKGRIYGANLSEFKIFCADCYNNDVLNGQFTNEQLMIHEHGRLLSFNNCPYIEKYSTIKLAKCGFYYTGKASTFKCFCCGLSFTSLPIDKTIEEVHRQRSPFCKFVRGEDLSNVPSHHPVSSNGLTSRFPNLFGCRQNKGPKYPDQSSYETRLSSFRRCSLNFISPQWFAEAGLFFVLAPDLLRCFDCGTNFRNWQEEEDPWIQHARRSPNCQHVRRCKGSEFIKLVRLADIEFEESPNIAEHPCGTFLNSAAQACILAGHSEEIVKKAVQVLRTDHGIQSSLGTLQTQLRKLKLEAERSGTASRKEGQSNDSRTEQRDLLEDMRQLRETPLCKICLDQDCSIIFLPCGHLVCCQDCATQMRKCPICRALVKETVRAYFS